MEETNVNELFGNILNNVLSLYFEEEGIESFKLVVDIGKLIDLEDS